MTKHIITTKNISGNVITSWIGHHKSKDGKDLEWLFANISGKERIVKNYEGTISETRFFLSYAVRECVS